MDHLIRSRLFWVAGLAALALALYLALGVFGFQTLFFDDEVNEDFPVAGQPAGGASGREGPGTTQEEAGRDRSGAPDLVSSGRFHPVAHEGTGEALVYRLEDGSHVLRLEDIDIFNGPALYVYAVAAPDANDADTILKAGFVSAGPLKGNRGSQTYELPADFDPSVHRSVSVWRERFSVNFATAPLG